MGFELVPGGGLQESSGWCPTPFSRVHTGVTEKPGARIRGPSRVLGPGFFLPPRGEIGTSRGDQKCSRIGYQTSDYQ